MALSTYYWGVHYDVVLFIIENNGPTEVTFTYKLQGQDQLELRYKNGFELGCGNATTGITHWIEGTAILEPLDKVCKLNLQIECPFATLSNVC